ncbi:MAG: IS630 family transposase [Thermoflexales bacterium]|nr:IS630 family transposase [Thermoflexales bacterium]
MGATLAFEDESGFSLVSALKRTWAPRGETPVIRTQISHHQRVNALGALLVTPNGRRLRLFSRLQRKNINGQHVVVFLKQLLRTIKGPIVWLWDNHRIHIRQLVKTFIAAHPRLHVFYLPSYAPELNPVEGLWTQAKEATAGSAPYHVQELHRNVYAALKHIANSPRRLRACFCISQLPSIKSIN